MKDQSIMLILVQEIFLHELGIINTNFTLNSASNLAPRMSLGNSSTLFPTNPSLVHRDLHYTLDKLGFFAITCSKSTLKAMIAEVDQENAKWQWLAAQDVGYKRVFLVCFCYASSLPG
jgi:hypothetical protein